MTNSLPLQILGAVQGIGSPLLLPQTIKTVLVSPSKKAAKPNKPNKPNKPSKPDAQKTIDQNPKSKAEADAEAKAVGVQIR